MDRKIAGAKVTSPKSKPKRSVTVFVARKPPSNFHIGRVTARLSKKPSPRNPRANTRAAITHNKKAHMNTLSRPQQINAILKRINALKVRILKGNLR